MPHSIGVLECCTSQMALLCVHVRQCVLKCARLSCAVSCMKECMQVLAHRVMCGYKWSLYFQKWSIVLGINEKLDHPVIACNCLPCEHTVYSTSSGMGVFFKVMVVERIIFF